MFEENNFAEMFFSTNLVNYGKVTTQLIIQSA